MADPCAPVIVAAGQLANRDRALELSPLELLASAVRAAAAEPSTQRLLAATESIGVVDCLSWPVPDPAALLADELGLQPHQTLRTLTSGTGPLELLADACSQIQAGELDVALIAGAEAINPFMRAAREGRATDWPQQPSAAAPTRLLGQDRQASHPAELAAGFLAPLHYYPWFENALRADSGHSELEHSQWLGRLWRHFAEVASTNPHAWTKETPSEQEITLPGPRNRMVAYPYTKLMSANIQVDQGAAVILCSARTAQQAGVSSERWVFVHAVAAAHDRWFASERLELHRSPAIAACAEATLNCAGIGIDDIAHLDLYSCFPSAVQIAAGELGIDLQSDSRALTVTGGLAFAGGPGSNYVSHSLASLTDRLREQPEGMGMLTAVGWYMTKHANALLSGKPPARGFVHLRPQAQVDALPHRAVLAPAARTAPLESYTVIYDRDQAPTLGLISCLTPDGRALASSSNPAVLDRLTDELQPGTLVQMLSSGTFEL